MPVLSASPLGTDPYSRFMTDAFDEKAVISVSTGFQSFFGRPEAGASRTLFSPDSSLVSIDIMRGNEKTSALIPRGIVSRPLGPSQKNTNAQKYSNFNRVYPLAEEEGDIAADQLIARQAGENPYATNVIQEQRLRGLALEHHQEHVRRIVRLFERLSAESILEGTMPAILGTIDPDLIYDFRRNAANIITVGTVWTNSAADILGDIDNGCSKVRQNGRTTPDMMILAGDTMAAFLADADVQAQADNRRFELIHVNSQMGVPDKFSRFIENGFLPRGRLRTPAGYELWMFTYIDGYDNSSGTFVNYMPSGYVSICNSQARCDRYFGPPERLPNVPARAQLYEQMFGFSPAAAPMPPKIRGLGTTVRAGMFHFDAYYSSDWKSATVRSQAAPIFATTQTDAFVTLKGTV